MERLKLFFMPCRENQYRPYMLGRMGIIALVALMLAAEGFLVASVVVRQSGGSFLAAVERGALIALTNSDRISYHLRPLAENAKLDTAAQAKADDMAAKGYFSHVGPDGTEPWAWVAAAGYRYDYAGENLAVHFADSSDVVNAWMASPTHRANMLKSQYTEIGIGVAQGVYNGEPATYVVEYFGSPATSRLAPATAAAAVAAVPDAADSPLPATAAKGESSGAPAVAGAVTPGETLHPEPAPAISSSQSNAFTRALLRLLGSPRETALWMLSGITLLLIVAVGLTLAVHVRIQPVDMLLGGASVAGMAILFLTLNSAFLAPTIEITAQAASVAASPLVLPGSAGASPAASIIITSASTARPELIP